jgi:mannonate dehydratase
MGTNELNRRTLIRGGVVAGAVSASAVAGIGSAAATHAANGRGRPGREPRMVVGTQRRANTVETLREFKRHGVERVWGYPPNPPRDQGTGDRGYWLESEVAQTKEFIESEGLEMDAVTLPFLTSSLIDRDRRPAIMLGRSPERDRDIDDIHRMIEVCASVGVSTIKYNQSLLGVLSTGEVPGRGGSVLRQFRATDLDYSLPDTIAGKVDADTYWERIEYFVDRVMPVANQYRVRMACHPQDPGTPPGGYRGVEENVLSVPGGEGLFKFLRLSRSPYHGLNLCCGTLAEMLWNPAEEIYPIFRRLVRTGRVFNIHLRNIKGRRNDFVECWPDEGVVDHAKIINIAADEGYADLIDPDHVPDSEADPTGAQGYAHGYGFIAGAIAGARHRSARS